MLQRLFNARWPFRFRKQAEPARSDYLLPEFLRHIDATRVRTVFELGAREGDDSLRLVEAFPCRLYAFECNPQILPECRERVKDDARITLVEKAVWDKTATIPFYPVVGSTWRDGSPTEPNPDEWNIGASSCYLARTDYLQRYEQEETRVEAIRLDEFCRAHNVHSIDLLCIDLQGGMLNALHGLGEKLRDVTYLIAEIERRPIYRGQALFPEIDRYLRDFGFRKLAEKRRDAWFGDYLYQRQGNTCQTPR